MKTFKNIKAFKLTNIDIDQLEIYVNELPFVSSEGKHQRVSIGFTNPIDEDENLFVKYNGLIFLSLAIENKVLPAKVIEQIAAKRVQELQKTREVTKNDKYDIKIKAEIELLVKAFTVVNKVNFYIDTNNNFIVIDSAKSTEINEVIKVLDKCGIEYESIANFNSRFLTRWFIDGSYPEKISFADKCKLEKSDTESKVLLSAVGPNPMFYHEDMRPFLEYGGIIQELDVVWEAELTFTITNYQQIKNIKILNFFNENSSDEVLHNLILMTGLFAKLLSDISSWGIGE
ncbi:recombination-associated protein RdgC [Francisella philomiragia]|uniref:Recombination-associated protein RdgC n=1 Tax=Francisella philomiragia TaxID=28110 RepID=A0A0B6CPZ5_9GAMM|nr:recombination-associated protein RdgC [Francisella philomiragia]AJI52549.1 exonuclease, RdgC family protein [Francisella philomiragia]